MNDKINNFAYPSENLDKNFDSIANYNTNTNIDNLLFNSQNSQVNNNKTKNIIKFKKDDINKNKIIINDNTSYNKYKYYVRKHLNYLTNPNLEKQIKKI